MCSTEKLPHPGPALSRCSVAPQRGSRLLVSRERGPLVSLGFFEIAILHAFLGLSCALCQPFWKRHGRKGCTDVVLNLGIAGLAVLSISWRPIPYGSAFPIGKNRGWTEVLSLASGATA